MVSNPVSRQRDERWSTARLTSSESGARPCLMFVHYSPGNCYPPEHAEVKCEHRGISNHVFFSASTIFLDVT
jgi:hypothetical protein